ncbi:MAG: hypothetical protein U9Q29_06305 [Campylobacterota bacterium]|nr:hypothetical protein [Campylobacterota bacterium]
MDVEIIFSFFAIVVLIVVIVITFKQANTNQVRSKANKKIDIVDGYKKRLRDELLLLDGDQEAIKNKKSALLKEFNMELSRNIFFDKDEIRKVILELSQYA